MEYHWIRALGGRRNEVRPDSPHTAWRVTAFRSYADYADSDDFQQGLDELTALARRALCAYMCSEGLWWRCHRRLISDRLLLAGWQVMHILPDGKLSGARATRLRDRRGRTLAVQQAIPRRVMGCLGS